MPYASQDDLIARFGETELIQLTDRASEGVVDADYLAVSLTEAQAEVDSYIGAIYDLPLLTTPVSLITATCNIARYRLYNQQATEEVKIRYDDTIRWLRDVARGLASLGLPATQAPESQSIVVQSRTQIFTDAVMNGMGPSWP